MKILKIKTLLNEQDVYLNMDKVNYFRYLNENEQYIDSLTGFNMKTIEINFGEGVFLHPDEKSSLDFMDFISNNP